jgi:FkbM family methyltransferase
VQSENPKITAMNIAISQEEGTVDFYKINTDETITDWEDGNPGASSLLESSGSYPHEKYVQDIIQIQSRRAFSLIEDHIAPQPQLIWMDVEGSEDQVLKSFDHYLTNVDTILVELSLKQIYHEQPLALEVIELIKDRFYFSGVLNVGEWQFDAYLVNKNAPNKLKHWLLNAFYTHSLKTRYKFGISRNFPNISEIVKWFLGKFLKYFVNWTVQILRRRKRNSQNILSDLFLKLTNVNSEKLAHYARRLVEASLPSNPLRNYNNAPEISVLIPIISKDYKHLNLVICKILENSLNPVKEVIVVHSGSAPDVDAFGGIAIKVISEDEFVPEKLEKRLMTYDESRRGWVRQQVIKFLGTVNSKTSATLICDSDTFLVSPQLWLDETGRQQLQVCHEYSKDYEKHYQEVFGKVPKQKKKLSYVTHHQLMQKSVVLEMFGENLQGLESWLKLGDFKATSPISEYHSYGRFLIDRFPEKVLLSSWNNLFISNTEEDLVGLIYRFEQNFASISVHKY